MRRPDPSESSEPRSAPRRLERNLGEGRRAGGGGGAAGIVAETVPEAEGSGAGSPGGGLGVPRSEDDAAGQLAREWFAAFVRGDIPAMTTRASFPFLATAGVVAQKPEDLARMLTGLVAETPTRTSAPVTVETSAGLRKRIGKLPPGLDDGSGLLFAVTQSDGDILILRLARTGHGPGGTRTWKAVGLIRR